MKKCIIVLLVLLVSAGMAFGEDVLDPLYLEWGIRGTAREFLYPEVQYNRNPSVLVGLENVFLRPYLRFTRDSTVITRVRGDDTEGEEGATEEESSVATTFNPHITSFFPVGTDMTLGVDAGFWRQSESDVTETDEDYVNGDPETIEEDLSSAWWMTGTGYGAFDLGGLDFGIALGGSLFRRPGESQEEKVTVDGETTYTGADTDRTDYNLNAATGVTIPVGDGSFGLGGTFSYGVVDILPWSVDPDDDSQIIPDTDRDDVHDYLDQTTDTRLSLHPSFVFPVSPQVTFISTGMVGVIGTEVSEFYDRADEDDESLRRTTIRGTFPTFSLGAGVAWRPSDAMELRTGLNVAREGLEEEMENFDTDGESTFENANTIGAWEAPLGADPEPHEIIDAVPFFIGPMESSETIVTLDSGITFSPAGPVTLFTGGGMTLRSQSVTYKVFNTDTNEIVEATDDAPQGFANNFNMSFNTTLGAAVELSDNVLASFHAAWPFSAVTASRNTVDLNPGGIDDEERVTSNFGTDLQVIFRF